MIDKQGHLCPQTLVLDVIVQKGIIYLVEGRAAALLAMADWKKVNDMDTRNQYLETRNAELELRNSELERLFSATQSASQQQQENSHFVAHDKSALTVSSGTAFFRTIHGLDNLTDVPNTARQKKKKLDPASVNDLRCTICRQPRCSQPKQGSGVHKKQSFKYRMCQKCYREHNLLVDGLHDMFPADSTLG